MPLEAYLNFDGNCREAANFYAQVFDQPAPKIMTFGEGHSPEDQPMPEEVKNRVMHSQIELFGNTLMFSDTFPGQPFIVGNNISLTVVTTDRDAIVKAYDRLKAGGQVVMELQETFWSKLYGMVTDKYGIAWQFSLDSGETF